MHARPVCLLLTAAACGAPTATRSASTLPDPPGYTIHGRGDVHDFDTFAGAWRFTNRRLKKRGVGSHDWDEFPATSCTTVYLNSIVNVDEITFPTKGWSGITFRHFDVRKQQWAIYWVNSRDGALFPPVVGGFSGETGDFYGEDTDDGKPVKVRFHWTKYSPDHLKWEQSFSYDGVTWELNWMNELTRADPAACVAGRPVASI